MEPLEIEYRALMPWVAEETLIRLPPSLRTADGWRWDQRKEQLVGMADVGEFRFHVELIIGRSRVHEAVLTVRDDRGSVDWQSIIPPDVVASAKRASGRKTGEG